MQTACAHTVHTQYRLSICSLPRLYLTFLYFISKLLMLRRNCPQPGLGKGSSYISQNMFSPCRCIGTSIQSRLSCSFINYDIITILYALIKSVLYIIFEMVRFAKGPPKR